MSDQESPSVDNKKWYGQFSFVKLFQGFRSAVQPGKLLLAAMGIAAVFLWGWTLDGFSGKDVVVLGPKGNAAQMTELDTYVSGSNFEDDADFLLMRKNIYESNLKLLENRLTMKPFDMEEDEADDIVTNKKFNRIEKIYKEHYNDAWPVLNERLKKRRAALEKQLEDLSPQDEDYLTRKQNLENEKQALITAYNGLFKILLGRHVYIEAQANQYITYINRIVKTVEQDDEEAVAEDRRQVQEDKEILQNACRAAYVHSIVQALEGRGIFDTFTGHKLQCIHSSIAAMIRWDCQTVKKNIWDLLLGACWLTRFHQVYSIFLILGCLAIWALFGGAICRMTAVSFAREERIGPFNALKFSAKKFVHMFSAPLLPIFIILLLGIMLWLPSWLVYIPRLGEIIGAFLFPLALVAGFIIALIIIGLIGGYNLMVPTIAVEGSDGFDAISRSFSYIFARPWHMIFYSLIGIVYGALCYLFVRIFALLMLFSVHVGSGSAVNFDKTKEFITMGKLDAMWPWPSWTYLHPGWSGIPWTALNATECFGAFFITLWVALVVAVVLGFLVSFYFSVNTIIYFLLRQHVDSTDYEDLYVEEDMDSLLVEDVSDETTEPATPETQESQEPQEKAPEEKSEVQPPAESPEEDDEDKKKRITEKTRKDAGKLMLIKRRKRQKARKKDKLTQMMNARLCLKKRKI